MTRPQAALAPESEFRRQLLAIIPHLRAFARGLCGRPDQADDLVQETAIRAWAARASFSEGTNFRAWTFRIMRNHFLNELRRNRRETELDDETANSLVSPASQEDAVHVSDLEKALAKLPDERREALLLVGAGGFTYEEAAEITGVAVGTMKSRVARGRTALAELLDGRGDGVSQVQSG